VANDYTCFDPWLQAFIRAAASSALNHDAFSENDRDDIEQELAIAALTALSQSDPSRSKSPDCREFMWIALRNRVCDLIEAAGAKCRDYRLTESLDEYRPDIAA